MKREREREREKKKKRRKEAWRKSDDEPRQRRGLTTPMTPPSNRPQ